LSKVLVIYYSFEGNTELIAQIIAKETQGDLLKLKPVKEFDSTGFSKYILGGAQVFMKKKPQLMDLNMDLSQYDYIFIGSPIWVWTYTPPIKSLLEGDYLNNQHIYFFYTHDGGPGKVEKIAQKVIEKNNTFCGTQGFVSVKKDIEKNTEIALQWISKINLSK